MIRLATLEDIPYMLPKAEQFFNESSYANVAVFDAENTRLVLEALIEQESCIIDNEYRGGIGFVIGHLYMSKDTMYAQELFWWVDKSMRGSSLGIKLLKAAEKLAKEQGADLMTMVTLNELEGSKVGKLLEKTGYTPCEQNHIKEIT